MGTLGCINDMMQRDKENRELRKVGKKRMSETHGRLLGLTGKRCSSDISPEKVNIYYHCNCGFSIGMAGDFVAFVESAVL
mgnify:CR=1 FL=1